MERMREDREKDKKEGNGGGKKQRMNKRDRQRDRQRKRERKGRKEFSSYQLAFAIYITHSDNLVIVFLGSGSSCQSAGTSGWSYDGRPCDPSSSQCRHLCL